MKNVRILRRENGENCRSREFMVILDIKNGLGLHIIVILGFFQTYLIYVMGGKFNLDFPEFLHIEMGAV